MIIVIIIIMIIIIMIIIMTLCICQWGVHLTVLTLGFARYFLRIQIRVHLPGLMLREENKMVFHLNLGLTADQFLTFQGEIKFKLGKMASAIKALPPMTANKMKQILFKNALVIFHLCYPAILLSGITK